MFGVGAATATLRLYVKNECHQRVQRAEFALGEPKGELGNAGLRHVPQAAADGDSQTCEGERQRQIRQTDSGHRHRHVQGAIFIRRLIDMFCSITHVGMYKCRR